MARRFYLPSSGAAPVSPNFGLIGFWNNTTGADRIKLSRHRSGTSMADKTASESTDVTQYYTLARQYVSDTLIAQTIAGNVKGQIRCAEDNSDADFSYNIKVGVVSNDGTTLRGTLLNSNSAVMTTEFATSLTNRNFPPSTALSSVTAQDGDRLVIEVGFSSFNTILAQRTATFRLGDNGSTDLAEDETSTTDNVPWIEFSQTIYFDDEILLGDSSGLSTADALLKQLRKLAGTADGLSTSDAAIKLLQKLSGTADGLSTADALLKQLRKLAGTSDGLSTADALLKQLRKLAGTSDGLSTADAALKELRKLAGTADGLSTADALMQQLRKLAGTADGLSTADAAIKFLQKMLATSHGFALVRGVLTIPVAVDLKTANVRSLSAASTLIKGQDARDVLIFKDWPVTF